MNPSLAGTAPSEDLIARDAYVVTDPVPIAREPAAMRPLQRLQLLCDEGSLAVIRSAARSQRLGEKARPGDGVVGAAGRVGGRPIFCFAQDASSLGGSLGEVHASKIVRVLDYAERSHVPVIALLDSGGARIQEGVAALDGYGAIFRRNVRSPAALPRSAFCSAPAQAARHIPPP